MIPSFEYLRPFYQELGIYYIAQFYGMLYSVYKVSYPRPQKRLKYIIQYKLLLK
jgi:hypothetical protein